MVVQSIALPKVSGSTRDDESAVDSGEVAVAPVAAGRSLHVPVLLPLLVAIQGAWLALLGYAAVRILL
jgi:hypothetical protein